MSHPSGYKNLLKLRYIEQRQAARRRGITFLLTYAEWLAIWQASGRLDERGRSSGQFCMSRFGDEGVYCVGNVEIRLCSENTSDGQLKRSPTIPRYGEDNPHFGKKHSAETKAICAEAASKRWKDKPKTSEQRYKMALARKAWWERQTPEQQAARSASLKKAWERRRENIGD